MGIPMGLQYSVTAIGSVILQTAVNTLGSDYIAAMAAATKINGFICCPFDALGSTIATYGAQNLGAGKIQRIREGAKDCMILGLIYAIISFLILFFFGRNIGTLFIDPSEIIILDNMQRYLVTTSAFFFPLALVNIFRLLIQGLGFTRIAIFSGLFEMTARTLIAFLVPAFGFGAVCFASPAAWVLADFFLIPTYFRCMKRLPFPHPSNKDKEIEIVQKPS